MKFGDSQISPDLAFAAAFWALRSLAAILQDKFRRSSVIRSNPQDHFSQWRTSSVEPSVAF